MSKRILITRANDFTGRHACQHFIEKGYEVIGTASWPSENNRDFKDFNMRLCDLTDENAVTELINQTKPDCLLHLEGIGYAGEKGTYTISNLKANMLSTILLLDALSRKNPDSKTLITVSALQAERLHLELIPHHLSKPLQTLCSLAWGKLYGLDAVIAKPSNLIGPGYSEGECAAFAKAIMNMQKNGTDRKLTIDNPIAEKDFLDVRDAMAGYEILLNFSLSGETYDVCSGKNRSIQDVAEGYKMITPFPFEIEAKEGLPAEANSMGNPARLLDIGWKPRYSFEDSLSDTLDFYLQT
ncbi:NAD-dependent epimerase/dehydratase family protein [Metabacillus sp. KIGAM252]|uniref:NAD-dependent epimerase/dehydratase family protein n=1 Tax=Metabacillus flavus TaxID=2823519 RepID=A0ABS5LEW6_9BACI|nr:NAD-dependent epimerase/dehydratase family protein [Metabacillus flavus]MBS2969295.1 NAD-dependent epimerase/dehydratase family protein [Metabacillus flavus]